MLIGTIKVNAWQRMTHPVNQFNSSHSFIHLICNLNSHTNYPSDWLHSNRAFLSKIKSLLFCANFTRNTFEEINQAFIYYIIRISMILLISLHPHYLYHKRPYQFVLT